MTKVVANFNDRLNEALEKRGMRPVDLVNKVDIPEATISQYRSGYAKPKYERVVRIADALNVNLLWLMGGDVPMEKNSRPVKIKKIEVVNAAGEKAYEIALDGTGHAIVPNPSDLEKMQDLYNRYANALPQIQEAIDRLLGSTQ